MQTTIVLWTYNPDVTPSEQVRDAHLDYLDGLVADGTLVAAGPRSDVPGGVLVFSTVDGEAVDGLLESDPFVSIGLIARTEIVPWTPKVGQLGVQAN